MISFETMTFFGILSVFVLNKFDLEVVLTHPTLPATTAYSPNFHLAIFPKP